MVKKLNHRARIIECCRGKIDVAEIVNTGLFKLDVAQSGYGWLQDLHAMTVREVGWVLEHGSRACMVDCLFSDSRE